MCGDVLPILEFNQIGHVQMKLFDSTPRLLSGLASAALALFLISPPASAQSAGAFSSLAGTWSGSGTVYVADGNSERIRCRATYNVGADGSTMQQNLRCASDSYKFELSTDIRSNGGNVSGYWSEATRNLNGTLEGRGGNGEFDVLVSANGFAAELNLRVSGAKQTIVMNSKNTELRGLNINLSKS
jgi:hypothetical protein